jgi:hypothetical protein
MKSFGLRFVLLSLFLLLIATSAGATQLSLTDCDAQGCEGSDVFLNVESAGGGNWNITLGLDSTGYFGSNDGVVQAGFKAISGATSVSLISASDGTWSAAKFAGINSNGLCSGGSEPDFACTSGYANIETDNVYTWNFFVEGGTVLDVSSWAIKFQYCDSTDEVCKGHLLSAHSTSPGTPVPEPSAALVFAGALLVIAPRLRRRR